MKFLQELYLQLNQCLQALDEFIQQECQTIFPLLHKATPVSTVLALQSHPLTLQHQ